MKITIANLIVSEFTMYQLFIVTTIIPIYWDFRLFTKLIYSKLFELNFLPRPSRRSTSNFLLKPGQCFLGSQNSEKQGGGIWRGGVFQVLSPDREF